ncbi:MAG: hypothetical protein Q7W05_14210 [Deltaproteobacteria bacterium]|nr:hypothetical protein [Deltaproteobacteria bacterium]
MKNKTIVLLLLLSVVGTCRAGIDSIGLYHDSSGQNTCIQDGVFSLHSIYLIIKNPSAPGAIGGWQGTLHADPGMVIDNVVLAGGGMNFEGGNDFMVGLAIPLPWASEVVLATFSVFAMAPGGMWFDSLVGGEYETPIYVASGDLRELYLEYGGNGNPSVTIGLPDCPELNGASSVRNECQSWSVIKHVYGN